MLNVVAIMGRLAADPEMRQTTTARNQCASFRIACDRVRRDAMGRASADLIDVVAWRSAGRIRLPAISRKGS